MKQNLAKTLQDLIPAVSSNPAEELHALPRSTCLSLSAVGSREDRSPVILC